jgi:hypothetical protein
MVILKESHFLPDNLKKQDLIIFCGGINDISKNESTKGFHSLKAFVQRTVNTNVMLLEVPHRYDLPSFSCVNTEVKLFNKKLHCLEFIFKHVRSYRFPTERMHHTNHGLHLNKKGKSWIANNIVKEIKALFLPHRAPLPIVLPWKSSNFNMFQHNKGSMNETPSVVGSKNSECQKIRRNKGCQTIATVECLSPGKTVACQEHGNSIGSIDSLAKTGISGVVKTLKGS